MSLPVAKGGWKLRRTDGPKDEPMNSPIHRDVEMQDFIDRCAYHFPMVVIRLTILGADVLDKPQVCVNTE